MLTAHLFWDASALVKNYINEAEAATVAEIFQTQPMPAMTVAFLGYAETAAIMRRKRDQGALSLTSFQQARLLLEAEVLLNPGYDLLTITDQDVLDGMALTDRHNLNTADAAMLAAFLRRAVSQPDCPLVAADRRLLRAAGA